MNCPICNAKMAHWDDRIGHTLMEEEHSCLNHYYEHFLTGYHERAIRTSDGWQIFQWNYTMPLEEVEAIKAEVEAVIALVKK